MSQSIAEIVSSYDLFDYIGSIVDLKRIGNEMIGCCPIHNDSKPSLKVYARNGRQRFKCFPCGSSGDIIDFTMAYEGCDKVTAIDIITGRRNHESQRPVIKKISVPNIDTYADFEPLPLPDVEIKPNQWIKVFNPKSTDKPIWNMYPSAVYKYDDGYVLRLDFKDGKNTPTVRWCKQLSTGLIGWVAYPFKSSGRAVFGVIKPSGTIIGVEGEKACAAGMSIFKNRDDISVITWSGGSNAVGKTDWSVLNGRQVILVPDNDQPGHDAMYELSCKIDNPLCVIPDGKPKGWDIADEKMNDIELIDFIMDNFGQLRPSDKLKQDK